MAMKGISGVFNTVAVIGATGAVGRIILNLLEEREFQAKRFRFLASARSAGGTITFRGEQYPVEELTPDSFAGVDLVIASTPDETARDFLPRCTCELRLWLFAPTHGASSEMERRGERRLDDRHSRSRLVVAGGADRHGHATHRKQVIVDAKITAAQADRSVRRRSRVDRKAF